MYNFLPITFQNIACSMAGRIIARKRYGTHFKETLELFLKSQWWDSKDLKQYRNTRLHKFVKFCYSCVPYYNKLFKKLNINPDVILNLNDLSKYLPILTKDTVRNHFDEFIPTTIKQYKLHDLQTSGSTGSGLKFSTTSEALQEQHAIYWRALKVAGANKNMWRASFGGHPIVPINQKKPPFWRHNIFGHQILYSGYHINRGNVKFYVEHLNKKKIKWIHGYPSLISLIASYIIEDNHLMTHKINYITVSSENLTHKQANLIKTAFGVEPIQSYGTTEATGGAFECEFGNLHIDEEFVAMEFIPIGSNQYKIIGTNFSNYAMPLLRYDNNDIATITNERCVCGRQSRIIDDIDGREEDYIVLPDGTKIGRLDHLFKDMIEVREAQILQQDEQIKFLVSKTKKYSKKHEQILKTKINKYLGKIEYSIIYTDNIARTKNGKLRFVIREKIK